MKKTIAILSLIIFTATFSACTLFEDSDEIFEKFHEVDGETETILRTIEVTAIIDDEIEKGKYEEYVPKHIADFMIRTIGYNEFEGYIEERRENQLKLQNEIAEDDDEGEPQYAEFIRATGNWNGYDSGSISVEFASDGGPVTAYFGGCPGGTCWSSTATGYYDGGEGGSVLGNIDGYMEADEYMDAQSIWGSFSGNIYLAEEYASGTFSLSVGEYGDSGTWYASFDNGL